MKTRSQSRKEKLDNESRKIPQLNEDVLGIILKYVMKEEENFIYKNFTLIDEYCDNQIAILDPLEGCCKWPSNDEIEWPDYLYSNSRRLIHHTNVKLFPNCVLTVPNRIEIFFKTKRELDLLWRTFKHFGDVRFWTDAFGSQQTAAKFLQNLLSTIQRPSQLVRRLEDLA